MKIVHPTDFSDCAEQARALAVQLARALGAELILLHVAVETPLFREGLTRARELEHFFDEQRERARRTLEERAAETRGQGVPTLTRVVTGAPHQEIVETAEPGGRHAHRHGYPWPPSARAFLYRQRGRPGHPGCPVSGGNEAGDERRRTPLNRLRLSSSGITGFTSLASLLPAHQGADPRAGAKGAGDARTRALHEEGLHSLIAARLLHQPGRWQQDSHNPVEVADDRRDL